MLLETLDSLWAIEKVDNSKLSTFEDIKNTVYSHSLEIYPQIQDKIQLLEQSMDTYYFDTEHAVIFKPIEILDQTIKKSVLALQELTPELDSKLKLNNNNKKHEIEVWFKNLDNSSTSNLKIQADLHNFAIEFNEFKKQPTKYDKMTL